MKKISEFSIEELEQEINRRKSIMAIPIPSVVSNPDWTGVISMCEGLIADIINKEYYEADGDFPHYLFEEVFKTVYGDNFFEWYNKNVY